MKPDFRIEVKYPFPDASLPQLWSWCEAFRNRVADDYAPQTIDQFVNLELAREQQGVRKFGVYRDDELGGAIWLAPENDIVVSAHCVFKREFFGRKTTYPALYQMAEMTFEAGFQKISMQVFEDNDAIKCLLQQIGARREGTLKSHTLRQGSPVDVVLFALFPEYLGKPIDYGKRKRPKVEIEHLLSDRQREAAHN